ncbi:MAG: PLP-dependent aminotransferase family protein [Tepidisphaeraceae bacterium]
MLPRKSSSNEKQRAKPGGRAIPSRPAPSSSTSSQSVLVSDATLYEQVAARIDALIVAGTLRPGQRVPSVRKLADQVQVSISTVLQAYRLLEDRGRIEAKPQSGYYVRARFWTPPPEPAMSRCTMSSTKVSTTDVSVRILQEGHCPNVVPLGAALSSPAVMPTRQLNRISASIGRRMPRLAASYDPAPGCELLRVQVARRALEAGCTLSPDDVVTTFGTQEAVGLCLRAVAKTGDTIAIESPTFYGLLQLIQLLGMKALEIPTHPRDGVSLPELRRALDGAAAPVKACLFVNNFNNPLGSMLPDTKKKQLVEMLAEREIPLIEDDIYGDLGFDSPRPKSAKAFDRRGLVLACSSYSKTLAAGYRVGWCAPGRWRDEVAKLKLFTNLATATIPQMAIAEFLATGGYEHHLRRVRKVYAGNIARVTQAVCEYFPPGTKVTRPQGGFVLWVE